MKRTCFIVGAGASTDFRMPLGLELARNIRVQLQGDFAQGSAAGPIIAALGNRYGRIGAEMFDAAAKLRGSLISYTSIDRALASRDASQPLREIGKFAIAHAISYAEQQSELAKCSSNDTDATHLAVANVAQAWTFKLLHHLIADRQLDDLSGIFDVITFIVFNYDRCIEQSLYYGLTEIYGQSSQAAQSLLSGLQMVHVYGDLGDLSYGRARSNGCYGEEDPDIAAMADRIQIFTEGSKAPVLSSALKMINEAEQIVFLGFAYERTNLEMIFPSPLRDDQQVFGTALNFTEHRRLFTTLFGDPDNGQRQQYFLHNQCGQFLDQHGSVIVG